MAYVLRKVCPPTVPSPRSTQLTFQKWLPTLVLSLLGGNKGFLALPFLVCLCSASFMASASCFQEAVCAGETMGDILPQGLAFP